MLAQELKGLQTRLTQAKVDYDIANQSYKVAHENVTKARQTMQNLERQIKDLQESSVEPIVTEHAMLRYLERVRGVDLEELRQEILNDKTSELIKTYKSGKFPVGDTHRVVVKKGTIVTIEA